MFLFVVLVASIPAELPSFVGNRGKILIITDHTEKNKSMTQVRKIFFQPG